MNFIVYAMPCPRALASIYLVMYKNLRIPAEVLAVRREAIRPVWGFAMMD
jgi:hypothetical protein